MAQNKKDANLIPTITGASNADGTTPVNIVANPSTHILQTSDGVAGSDLSGDQASRDDNGVPVMLAVSSADGITPVPIYADPATGQILIKSV